MIRCATGSSSAPPKMELAESKALWDSGRIIQVPLPFYGLEGVDYANGHGTSSYGR